MEFSEKLKYVGLELMRKDAKTTDEVDSGLFRGLRTRSEGDVTLSLILLGDKDEDDSIRGLNSEVFNIMTLLLKYGQTQEMIVFKNTAEDQKEAYELIESVIEKLKTDKLMLESDPDIVDTSKYTEIDEKFFKAANKSTTSNNSYNRNTAGTNTTGTTDWQKKQAEEKKEKERQEKIRWTPFSLARKSKKPAIKDLNLIKKKVAALAEGSFIYEDFPDLEKDEEDKKISTTAK